MMNAFFTKHNFLSTFIFITLLTSCKKDDENLPIVDSTIDIVINGSVQKGPFVSGSTITIQELKDTTLSPTGKTYITSTTNDFGKFFLESKISSGYIELISQGYYFNEVSGQISDGPLTLSGLVKTSETLDVNINILTTLTKDRIKYLMSTENKSFEDAKIQAEKEVLKAFGIVESIPNGFESLDISKNTEGDAILIAISSILQSLNSVGELSEIISKINLDLKEDGILSNGLIQILKENESNIQGINIRNNLLARYSSLGLSITVPEYEKYLDADQDGIINKEDEDNDDVFISGVVQKGPFVAGANVWVTEISSTVSSHQTGSFTTNSLGAFSGICKVNYPYLEVQVSGNFYNEVTGVVSTQPITLEAFIPKNADSIKVNVNILTTLASRRIQHLINSENKGYIDARAQAEKEVLAIFGIIEPTIDHFEDLDITKNRIGDLILLAVSTNLLSTKQNIDGLSYLPQMIHDIEIDGKVEADLQLTLREFCAAVDFSNVRKNLIDRYLLEGSNIEIGAFEDFLDLDGDGLINKLDPETYVLKKIPTPLWANGSSTVEFNNKLWYLGKEVWSSGDGEIWTLEKSQEFWNERVLFESIVNNDKLWILGGRSSFFGPSAEDVLYSGNGTDWSIAADTTSWRNREYFTPITFEGKVWIIGGQRGGNEIWSSSDMTHWDKVLENPPFGERLNSGCIVYNNKIWLFGGEEAMIGVKDIWYSSDGKNWVKSAKTLPWSFGVVKPVIYEGKIWVLGPKGEIWSSRDGENWEKNSWVMNIDFFDGKEYSVTVFNNKICLVPHTSYGERSIYYLYSYKP
ncbi:MAG TPA: hypothetical protein VD908_12015 [Cytophagales bacterium]|nr:hypothetical protein [Cytophagales bacterium]